MKTIIGAILVAVTTTSIWAQDITGTWRYIDDKTGEPKGLVKIEKQANGTYAGTALKATPRPGYTAKEFCTSCPAPYTEKPIIGMQVITGLKTDNNINYTHGKIIDPVSGKLYSLKGKISPNGKKAILKRIFRRFCCGT